MKRRPGSVTITSGDRCTRCDRPYEQNWMDEWVCPKCGRRAPRALKGTRATISRH